MHIGEKINQLRKSQKMTLKDLSEGSGVQIATLSRIENGKMTGTLESHMKIAEALGISLTGLYSNIDQENRTVSHQAKDHSTDMFVHSEKSSYEILTAKVFKKKMMPIMLKIEPGGRTNPEQNQPGTEKFLYVLDGRINAYIGEDSFPLSAQHTLYFDASLKHCFGNEGSKTARVICVCTPVAL